VLAFHVVAARTHRVALDRLLFKSVAVCGPIFEGALFEIEIQRLAISTFRQNARGFGRKHELTGAEKGRAGGQTDELAFHNRC
jgi:hypothetical protein